MKDKENCRLDNPISLTHKSASLIRGWLESPNGVAWRWTLGRKSGMVKFSGEYHSSQLLRFR